MTPAVSVVVPTYNRPDLLERAVRSVLNQTFSELECIVVNDGAEQSPEECVDDIIEGLVELGVLEETLEDRYEFSMTSSEEAKIKDRLRSRGLLE